MALTLVAVDAVHAIAELSHNALETCANLVHATVRSVFDEPVYVVRAML